jgi:hypothetical protein
MEPKGAHTSDACGGADHQEDRSGRDEDACTGGGRLPTSGAGLMPGMSAYR